MDDTKNFYKRVTLRERHFLPNEKMYVIHCFAADLDLGEIRMYFKMMYPQFGLHLQPDDLDRQLYQRFRNIKRNNTAVIKALWDPDAIEHIPMVHPTYRIRCLSEIMFIYSQFVAIDDLSIDEIYEVILPIPLPSKDKALKAEISKQGRLKHFTQRQREYIYKGLIDGKRPVDIANHFLSVFPYFGSGVDEKRLKKCVFERVRNIRRKNQKDIQAFEATYQATDESVFNPMRSPRFRLEELQTLYIQIPLFTYKGYDKKSGRKKYKDNFNRILKIFDAVEKELKDLPPIDDLADDGRTKWWRLP